MSLDLQILSAALAPPSRLSSGSYWHGHVPFAHFIVALHRPRLIVEFGVEHGDSLFAFADAVRWNGVPGAIVACDMWKGDAHVGPQDEWVYDRVRSIAAEYSNTITLLRENTIEASRHFADRSVDLLHIDASHQYEAVRDDFHSMRDKLSDRAIVLFHDTAVYSEPYGVWRLWQELREQFPHIDFVHSCGLGVLWVGKEIEAPVRTLFDGPDQDKVAVSRLFSALGHGISLRYDTAEQREALARIGQLPFPPGFEADDLLRQCLARARW